MNVTLQQGTSNYRLANFNEATTFAPANINTVYSFTFSATNKENPTVEFASMFRLVNGEPVEVMGGELKSAVPYNVVWKGYGWVITDLDTYLPNKLSFDRTIVAAGTTSAQTINQPSGRVNLAAGATSVVVTDNLVKVTSMVQVSLASNDSSAKSVIAVPANGSFTIVPNAASTAEIKVDFIVIG